MSLLDKRQAARQSVVEAGGFKFTIRRPTAYERASIGGQAPFDLLCKFVVGWNLNEIDLIPGGSPTPAAFDSELLADYLADNPELWEPLTVALAESIRIHDEAVGNAAKN